MVLLSSSISSFHIFLSQNFQILMNVMKLALVHSVVSILKVAISATVLKATFKSPIITISAKLKVDGQKFGEG